MRQLYRWRKLGSLDGLRLESEAMPALGTRDVLVRMRAFSLNYRDLMIARDQYPLLTKPDLVPLSDGSGEVVEVGRAVTRFRPGDRVASNVHQRWFGGPPRPEKMGTDLGGSIDGVLADHVVLGEEGWVRLPDLLSFEMARACHARP